MRHLLKGLAAGLLVLAGSVSAASAALFLAEATLENAFFTDFRITFTDRNGNGLVDFAEITAFSGVGQIESDQFAATQGLLLALPQIDGFSAGGALPGIDMTWNLWTFSGTGPTVPETFGPVGGWTYAIATTPGPSIRPPTPVPLPSAALLLTAALAGLGTPPARRSGARRARAARLPVGPAPDRPERTAP
jgi:hypothetical protein